MAYQYFEGPEVAIIEYTRAHRTWCQAPHCPSVEATWQVFSQAIYDGDWVIVCSEHIAYAANVVRERVALARAGMALHEA